MNGFKSCKKPAENEKNPRSLKFFRHLEFQEKVRGEGTHFKVPWATWKPRMFFGGNFSWGIARCGGNIWL